MSVKKRIIKNTCVPNGEYNLDFKSYIHVLRISILLWIKRNYRRVRRGVGYCKYSLLIVSIWGLFLALVCWWGKQRGQNLPLSEYIWDSKYGFFSSVIIAAAMSFFTQYSRDRNKYTLQHHLYKRIMYNFTKFYDLLLNISDIKKTRDRPSYDIFYYSEDIRKKIRGILPEVLDVKNKTDERNMIIHNIDNLRIMMIDVADNASKGNFADCEYTELVEKLNSCKYCLDGIEEELSQPKVIYHWDTKVANCVSEIYNFLELIRKPWRRDINYKLDMLRTIYKQDNSVASTYYEKTFLGLVDNDFYSKAPK